MPLVYRSMEPDGDYPKIGNTATTLGVRVSDDPEVKSDIPVFEGDIVRPRTGGMSVSPRKDRLPLHRIPRSLKDVFPGAAGKNSLVCWMMGEGLFEEGDLATSLWFRPDPKRADRHGFVEPDSEMTLSAYRDALGATQQVWRKEEWIELNENPT